MAEMKQGKFKTVHLSKFLLSAARYRPNQLLKIFFTGIFLLVTAININVAVAAPASGVKQLYFDLVNTGAPDLTRTPPAADTQTGTITSITLNQGTVFQTPFTITGGNDVVVQLRIRRRTVWTARTVQLQLFNGNTGTLIGTGTTSWNAPNWQTINVNIPVGAADVTFAAGDFVRLQLDMITTPDLDIQLRTLQTGVYSEMQIQSSTVINVDSIGVYDAAYPAGSQLVSYEPGTTVYIRSTVSDPFGSADITSANITITDPTPVVQVNNQAMTSVATPTASTRVYEYQYTIPATPVGTWDISITANEGTEGTVSHTAPGAMTVATIPSDYGDAPDSYGTLIASAGARHKLDNTIYIGAAAPDTETDGLPTMTADGDDLNNTDDENGIASFPNLFSNSTTYSLNVNVTNNSGAAANLVGWIDFNANGTFEASEGAQTAVANGTTGATVALNWAGLSGLVGGNTYVRIRLSSDVSLTTSTAGGAMTDGEVEDYPLSILTVAFDKYVSTDASCIDVADAIVVTSGDNVYYCYTVTNPTTSAFVISSGNTSDSLGHDISGLEGNYAAAATQTVVVGPIVAGSVALPTGATTINNAQVVGTFFGTTDVSDNETASVTVSAVLPATGNKQLYFDLVDTGAPDLTRTPPAADTQTGQNVTTFTLNQSTVFQKPFTIDAGNTVNVQLRIRRRIVFDAREVQIQILNGNTGTLLGTGTQTWNAGNWQTVNVPIALAAAANFAAGDFVQIQLDMINTTNREIQLRTLQGTVRSEVQMQSSTVINVDSISVYAATYPSTTQYPSYQPGSTVYIRSTVSDPFGSADINSADITITDPTPTVQVTAQAMTSVATPTTSTRVFEYQYTIPATPDGSWGISITANEGTEGTVSHTSSSTMIVGNASMVNLKSSAVISDSVNATNPKRIPGSIIEYTILITNTGYGYSNNNSIILTDSIPAQTTLFLGSPVNPAQFTDGTISSGLTYNFNSLASAADDIAFSNDGGTTFITPTVDASGFDTTVPSINFIRINPKGAFRGTTDGVNNPSFSMTFRVRVN